jgi:hypothetical protein
MARCEESFLNSIGLHRRKAFFHRWGEWTKPFSATYRGVLTLIQTRECCYCGKTQVRAL